MSAATKKTSREIRRALGPAAADVVALQEVRLQIALGVIRAGFWGRLKWLLFGARP